MLRRIRQCLASVSFLTTVLFAAVKTPPAPEPRVAEKPAAVSEGDESNDRRDAAPSAANLGKKRVVVIPVREQVDSPLLFIIRRGLKEAIEDKADVIVLDMKTPGGALDVTFEIMEALAKFPGKTITFINPEALSAGAFISATTEEIWFAPDGVIGAAAPVMSTGQEIDTTMRQKVVSYLKARVRATSEGKGYRGQVISAMIDADYELKIDDKVLKGKGELLSLTAKEASETHGDPAQPLLAAGVAKNVTDLLTQKFGAGNFSVKTLEVTWSERLAVFLRALSPLLLGAGLLSLYIEFKTPGFGVFGIMGIACLAIVFLSNFVAGLSGHEPMLVFGLGLVLVFLEVFFFPGVVVVALTGIVLMLGSLVWSMADIWPNEPLVFSGALFLQPLVNVSLGILIAVALAILLLRFLPRGWFWDRMILSSAVSSASQIAGGAPERAAAADKIIGRQGLAATALRPAGQVEIDGVRYEAKVEVGALDAGASVVVVRRTDFALIVKGDVR